MKLLNKTYLQYSGKVYDIKVSTPDHSYIINKAVVHNSAAGSLCAWLLSITKIDPIEYGLLFERFLNKGRIKKTYEYEVIKVQLDKNLFIELDVKEKVVIFRHSEKMIVTAKELQEGDEIISLKSRNLEEVLQRTEEASEGE
jgi:hypothetical protein